jgi:UDP-N-acetylmuramate--alanine ligase
LTRELIDNIAIHFDDSIDLVPKDFFVENTLVIITAVPSTHSEWNYFMERIILRKELRS